MAADRNEPDLDALSERIEAAKAARTPAPKAEEHYSQASQGWRMVIELVTGILIGFGIGYGLDRLFGTLPIFMVVFTGLGLAAGIRTMMRTAQEIQDRQQAADREGD